MRHGFAIDAAKPQSMREAKPRSASQNLCTDFSARLLGFKKSTGPVKNRGSFDSRHSPAPVVGFFETGSGVPPVVEFFRRGIASPRVVEFLEY
jgi:hypothetical protein